MLLPLIAVGLAVYALVDLASSDDEDRGGIPKGLWVVLIVLLPFVGPVAWILVKRSQRSVPRYGASGRPAAGPSAAGRRRRAAPLAPDDDPEFLWRLEQQQRRQGKDEPGATDGPGATGTSDAPTADDAPSVTDEPAPDDLGPTRAAGDDRDATDGRHDGGSDQPGTEPDRDEPSSR